MRRELATRAVAAIDAPRPIRVRVAMPDGPGHRIVFAHLRRDWRLIGIEAERVAAGAPADLRVIDAVSPARLVFAHLRRDWAAIGVIAVAAPADGPADLAFVDRVAPIQSGAWYLRRFMCAANPVCDADADTALDAARTAPDAAARRAALANADRILAGLTPYIALGRPLRWSLATQRLNGFRPSIFGRHPAVTLIVPESL
jgi:peptide/nickel transport system substrate-binding protein